ncbi:hypothetical protein ACHAXM_000652 [Skeletonema potamos]
MKGLHACDRLALGLVFWWLLTSKVITIIKDEIHYNTLRVNNTINVASYPRELLRQIAAIQQGGPSQRRQRAGRVESGLPQIRHSRYHMRGVVAAFHLHLLGHMLAETP